MFLRQLRWMAAGLAAVAVVCAAPSRSRAEIQVLVEELDASSSVVGSSSYFVGSPSGSSTFFQTFSYSSPNGYFTLSGSAGTNSFLGTPNASLSTSFTAGFTSNFDPTQGHTLRITVTDDKFVGTGPAILLNSAGAAVGFTGGTLEIDSFSRIYNPSDPSATPASSTTALANGPTTAGPTPTATDTLTDNKQTGDPALRNTSAGVSSLSSPYAVQQVVLVSVTPTGTIDTQSTFAGVAGGRVTPIPAPGGLALALIGLPLIGLRRALRRHAA